ncbi:oxidoreductase [Pseudomonas bohemica]|uniref:oxidoreductase n=1 Tax=Pseudomonas bohemica TaxID=2044872 RepID=UPI000DA612D9|nr:oxidoreductase [Pseudomonas bohemica]
MSKVWMITGASRGLGAYIATAALSAGDRVVATARAASALDERFTEGPDQLLRLALDVTDQAQANAAVDAALSRFGRIDVLVNNAGYGQLGPFETNTQAQVERQFQTNVFGVFNMCRAVLPAMRNQRSGQVFNLSSVGGLIGMGGASLYSASKFAVEGFSEALAQEVASFGIHVTLVEPGVFRTDFLDSSSMAFGALSVHDYAAFVDKLQASCAAGNHQQTGNPAKLADALIALANAQTPPLRYLAGSDAYSQVNAKLVRMRDEIERWQALSASTDGF